MQPDELGTVASIEEVAQAIQSLTDVDYGRLYAAAAIKMSGSGYADAGDLVNDAVLSPYRAALGEGGRRWKRTVSFMAFLFMTIQGLASDSRRSAAHRLTDSHRQSGRDDDDEDQDAFETLAVATPSVEVTALNEERQVARRRVMERLQEHFKDDPEVQWIMLGLEEDKGPEEIQELSSMTETQYETARRRWRRALEKLVPGRRRS